METACKYWNIRYPLGMADEVDLDLCIARNVRAELARRSVAQSQLAPTVGLTPASLSRRLKGHTSFSVPELAKIADVLGVSLESLLEPLPDQPELIEAVA